MRKQAIDLKQRDVDRKSQLAKTNAGSQADLDTSVSALVTAQLQSQLAIQQRNNTLNQLLGDPNLPVEKFPAYQQAQAALDQAQRDLDHTMLRAPIDGTATQVDNIQLGRFVMAGTPVFSVVDDSAPWVDANPKETDITYLQDRPARAGLRRLVPGPHLLGQCRRGQPRHRRAILDPAGAERQRQLGQGGAARSGAHPARPRSRGAECFAPA